MIVNKTSLSLYLSLNITSLLNGLLSHPQDLAGPDACCCAACAARSTPIGQQYADNQNISFLPAITSTSSRMHGDLFASSFFTGPPETEAHFTKSLHCRWNAIATQSIRLVPFQARGILPVAEEQSRTRGHQSGRVEDQPQCPGLWHSSSPCALSPSPPPPSFTQSPSFPRSLVRDRQTSPLRPRLVVSRSTCPPLSPSPHANSFVLGTAINNKHTLRMPTFTVTGP